MSDPNQPAASDGPGWSPAYRPTGAISYGWRKFKESPGRLLIPMLVVVVVLAVVGLIFVFVAGGGFFGTTSCNVSNINGQVSTECGQPFWRQLLGAGLGAGLLSLIGQILLAGLYRGATLVTEGKDFSLGQLLEGYSKAQVVFAAIFIAVATLIATGLCYLPGVAIAYFTSYTLFFIVDQEMEAAEAIQASVKFVWHNFLQTFLFFLLSVVVLAIGALLFGVGLLVAGPVVLMGLAYTYRRLEGHPVAP